MAATLFVQPLDLVKNRMQLSGEWTYQSMYVDLFYLQHTLKIWNSDFQIQVLFIKDAWSVFRFPYDRLHISQHVKYTKWMNNAKGIAKFHDK